MQRQTSSKRWLTGRTTSFSKQRHIGRADSEGFLPELGNSAASLKVNGIPDWENPMLDDSATPPYESPKSPRSLKGSRVNGSQRLPPSSDYSPPQRETIARTRSADEPHDRMPPRRASLGSNTERVQQRRRSSDIGPTMLEQTFQDPNSKDEVYDLNMEHMIIECDYSDGSSCGDLTYDGSVAYDENFHRTRHNYRRPSAGTTNNTARSSRSHLQNYAPSSPPKMPRQIRSSRPSPLPPLPTDERRTSGLSLEEEEQRQLEIAMERSMQDSAASFHGSGGSLMSVSRMSTISGESSGGSARNRASGSRIRAHTAPSLGNAGCHLTMIGARAVTPQGVIEPPGDAGPDFVWKREGKKWLKIPVSQADKGLNAIREHEENSEQRLERMEREMLEEAMQRSMVNFNTSDCGRDSVSRQDSSSSILDMSDAPTPTPSDMDSTTALARLQELEEERKMIERVILRNAEEKSLCSEFSSVSNRSRQRGQMMKQEPRQRNQDASRSDARHNSGPQRREVVSRKGSGTHGREPRRSVARMHSGDSIDSELAGAGCHLQMIGRNASRRNINDTTDGTEPHSRSISRTLSGESTNTQGQKLIWKRAPNGKFIRVPEPEEQNDLPPDEDEMIAEALKRSLNET